MSEFKILEERTLNYGGTDQLYVMIVRINGQYGIEINSRSIRVGRKAIRNRRQADIMLEQIMYSMSKYKDIHSAFKVFDLAFSMKSIRACLFLINVMNAEFEFNSIWKMKNSYGCETTPIITDLIFEDKSYDHTIHITFPGNTLPLGYFKAPSADEKFTFYVNDYFLNQI